MSINFSTQSTTLIKNKERIPVEADYYKEEAPYQILLHILDGRINELEFVSYTGSPDLEYPKAGKLKININEK